LRCTLATLQPRADSLRNRACAARWAIDWRRSSICAPAGCHLRRSSLRHWSTSTPSLVL